jgi:hypothetical protein
VPGVEWRDAVARIELDVPILGERDAGYGGATALLCFDS